MKGFLDYLFQDPPISERVIPASLHPAMRRVDIRWRISGLLLLAVTLALALLSPRFADRIPVADRPILTAIALMMLGGLILLFVSELVIFAGRGKRLMLWVLGVGLAMRLLFFGSTPILEVDFHRYLWDGSVTAHGLDPYRHAPADLLERRDDPTLPPAWRDRIAEGGATAAQINHGDIRSIYPLPVQAAFAAAYRIAPWSLESWRMLLLVADLATVVMLLVILQGLGVPPVWVVLYWWNPLVVKELFNSLHMEALLTPPLLGALWLGATRRPLGAGALLGLAASIKLWPALLLPLLLRPWWRDWRRLVGGTIAFAAVAGVLLAPMLLAGLDARSGLTAYGTRWSLNASLFQLILWGEEALLSLTAVHPGHAQRLARLTVALLAGGWALWLAWRAPVGNPRALFDRALLITAGLFLVLPTQFPWYALWFMPLLAVSHRRSLLILTVTLPLYYLWYHFDATGREALFHTLVPWIEFAPVWVLLWSEWRRERQRRSWPLTPEVPLYHDR